ncbi:MAG: helix-turn-helix transcriptional regulator [Bdellovibrionales bacterium]
MKKTSCAISTVTAPTPSILKGIIEDLRSASGEYSYKVWPTTPFHATVSKFEEDSFTGTLIKNRFQEAGPGCEQRIFFSPNQRAAFSLVLSESDHCTYEQRGAEFSLKKNDIMLLNNHEACLYSSKCQNMRLIGFNTDEQIASMWLPRRFYENRQVLNSSIPWASPLKDLLRTISATDLTDIDVSGTELANTICCYLSLCLDDPAEKISSYRETLLRRLRKEIYTNFKDPNLSVARVAANVGISQRTLHAAFQSVGASFREELVVARLNYAQSLLLEPTSKLKSMHDIAFLSGFSHRNNFLNAFKRYYGTTPAFYRKSFCDK